MEKDEDMTKVIDFFNRIMKSVEQKQVIEGKPSIIKKFKELSQFNKEKVLSTIIKDIELAVKAQENENNKEICRQEGHIFDKWEKIEYTGSRYIGSNKSSYHDHNGYLKEYKEEKYEKYHVTEWRRTCKRCGYLEKSLDEPIELIEERLENERQERIKKLKKELKELTNIYDKKNQE